MKSFRDFLYEDSRYNPKPGGHEWGTPQGTEYYKSLTPGQNNPKEDPIKPLNIKARKPEDEKAGTKITEGQKKVKVTQRVITKPSIEKIEEIERHGVPKDATKAQLKKIRSSDSSSKGAKQLAHWKLNMHHEDVQRLSAEKSKEEYPKKNADEAPDIDMMMTVGEGNTFIDDADVNELEKLALEFTFDDAIHLGLYDQDELTEDDFDGDDDPFDDHEINITEVLSVQGRLKRRFAAKRNKQKLRVARRIALRRGSTPDRLKRRAVRGARLMVYKRLLRGRDRAGLPPAEKQRLERMITRFEPLVSRISVKLLPQMRKNEIKRLTQRGRMKPKSSKKFKPAKPIAKKRAAKKFKAKGATSIKKPKKPKKFTPKKPKNMGTKAYKAFSYSVG